MRGVLGAAAIAAIVVATVGAASVTAAPSAPSMAPERVSDFQLTDTTRMAHRLSYFHYAPAIVLMSQWLMHRDARFFPDPLRFDPDRYG